MKLQQISDSIYLFNDTCNIYLIKRGSSCLAVDFGSGKILEVLPEIGVSGIEWVIHTHYHRDQCQGDFLLTDTRIAVPASEVERFRDVEKFWEKFTNFHKYSFTDFFTLRESISVSAELVPGKAFKWKDIEFVTLSTPGHTPGSISLMADIDHKRVVFTGDVIHSPGKIWRFFDLQWTYAQADGLAPLKQSIIDLLRVDADLLLPSHGEVMDFPRDALEMLQRQLARVPDQSYLYQSQIPNPSKGGQRRWVEFSPHVYYQDTGSTSWLMLSDSGGVVMCDCGDYWLDGMRDKVKRVEAVIISHYHDDHVDDIPRLQEEWDCQVWAFENMVDILEHPEAYHISCLSHHPIRVDRVLRENERLEWREYEFRVLHWPGHDEHHMALFGEIDGKKLLFNGDGLGAIRCYNYYPLDGGGYVKAARQLLNLNPDAILWAHYGYHYPTQGQMLDLLEWAKEMEDFFRDVIAQPHPEFGMDPHWVTIYPYTVSTTLKDNLQVEVRVKNYLFYLAECEVELITPPEWETIPQKARFFVEAKQTVAHPFCVNIPAETTPGRYVITANVTFQGVDMGEFAEALVFVDRTADL